MIDRPDTPHADVLLEGIWEDEVTPDDLASRALSAAQASSYAFRVASEGTTATAQLAEVDVSEFLESETGKWAQSFIGIVRVGESLVHVSHALGELARSLQQVNLEQSEIVYQVEAEIEAAELQSAQAGVDPADRIAELIAAARARAAEVAGKMVTPETTSSTKRPAAGLVSGFMAFGRVPGASAEATERNGRVARNGHARNGYAIRNTRADRNGHAVANGHDAADDHEVVNGRAGTQGHDSVNGDASAEHAAPAPKDAAAAAQDAFAESGDESTMDLGFLSFGRTPASAVPHAGDTASAADEDAPAEPAEPVGDDTDEDAAPTVEPVAEATEEVADVDAPVMTNGFLGLGRAPFVGVPGDDAAVPVVPQSLVNGFLALGRTPGAGEAAVQGPSSGPIPVVAPTQFLPLPTTPAEIVAGEAGEALGAEFGTPMTLSGALDDPLPDREDTRADAMDDGFLSFGRVPSSGWGGAGALPTMPTTPEVAPVTASSREPVEDEPIADGEESAEGETSQGLETADVDDDGPSATTDVDDPAAGELDDDDLVADELDDADDGALEVDDDTADTEVDFADELDAEADELLAPDEQDEDVIPDVEPDLDDLTDEAVDDDTDQDSAATEDTVGEQPADDGEKPVAAPPEAEQVEIALVEVAHIDPVPEDAAPTAQPAAARVEPVGSLAAAAARPVRKSGPVKFSDLLKAANAGKVEPAKMAPASFVAAAENPVVAPEGKPDADAPAALADESATSAELTPSAPTKEAEPAEETKAPAKPAPVLATGPAILGRTEPLVLRKKVSPVVQQVHDAVASILGSLRGGPHGPESGLHWAAGLLVNEAETIMAVTTSDAGWLPPGVVIPAGVRVLWNMPTGYRWASIDDPVRQLIEYAEQDGYTLTAVATTHPSRAYVPLVGEENVVGVLRPGAVLPGGRSRFEATVSPARLQHIRSLDREQAERQARALIRDLETQPIAPEHAIGIEAARIDARCFLDERDDVPPAVLEQLHADERALGDALILDRTPASAEDLTGPAPDAARLRDRMLERAILVATLAAAYHDIESAVYAWTYARFLSSQDQDSEQAR